MKMSEKTTGILETILGTTFFGLNSFFFLPVYQDGLNLLSTLNFRYFFGLIIMLMILVYRKKSLKVEPKVFMGLATTGFIFFMSAQFLFNALAIMPSGIVTTMFFTSPMFVMIFAVIFFKEKVESYKIFFSLMACYGIAVLSGFIGDVGKINLLGTVLTLFGAVFYGLYFLFLQKIQKNDTDKGVLIFYIIFFCGFYNVIYSVFENQFMLPTTTSQWVYLFGAGLFTGALANFFLVAGIKKIGSVLAAIFGAMEPITAVVVGILVFNEPMNSTIAIGIFIVLCSVILLSIYPIAKERLKRNPAKPNPLQEIFMKMRQGK